MGQTILLPSCHHCSTKETTASVAVGLYVAPEPKVISSSGLTQLQKHDTVLKPGFWTTLSNADVKIWQMQSVSRMQKPVMIMYGIGMVLSTLLYNHLEWREDMADNLEIVYFYKKPSYRWGTARRGRASWNLVKFCTNVDDLYLKSSETRLLPIRL